MKNFIILMSLSSMIAGCQCAKPLDPNWHRDCAKHYSETGKELEACKKRIENLQDFQ